MWGGGGGGRVGNSNLVAHMGVGRVCVCECEGVLFNARASIKKTICMAARVRCTIAEAVGRPRGIDGGDESGGGGGGAHSRSSTTATSPSERSPN